jgi:hypothetical protein
MGADMSSSTLEQVLEKVKELTAEEQQAVRELLDFLAEESKSEKNETNESKPLVTEEEFQKILVAKGIIRNVPSLIADKTPYENRKLLEVKGKPLSEIIIEERR